MKNFWLGFFTCLSSCLIVYIVWEHHRYVPVLIREVPTPAFIDRSPITAPAPPVADNRVARDFYF